MLKLFKTLGSKPSAVEGRESWVERRGWKGNNSWCHYLGMLSLVKDTCMSN